MPNAYFHLHHYPKQEVLAELLLENLREEGQGSPFHQSHVLVRNQGMATWIKRLAARTSGIAMQMQFPQPNRLLQEVLGTRAIDPECLKWDIYQSLPGLLPRKNFKNLETYLNSSADQTEAALKRYQLSGIIAGLFDKYLLYRPEWIASWQNNKRPLHIPASSHEAWQRELWRALTQHQSQTPNNHWSQVLLSDQPIKLPNDKLKSLHVFGISNFAPIYVQFLYRLSEQIPVHIYWMNPVEANQGYWEDAPSSHQWTMAKAFDDPETLRHHNPLLASFGRLGREFVHSLYGGNHNEFHVQESETHFASPVIGQPETRLQKLQSSLYNNQPGSNSNKNSADDTSVSIHSCHTPLRELETLKNYLLTLAEDQPLDTSDVLVMCPDIASYAPAVEAVFGGNEHPSLSYTIGDTHTPGNEPTVAAVLDLLELHTVRFTNHEALSLLSTPAVRNHFKLSEDDLGTIRDWISRNGIRWGFNEKHVKGIAPHCPESPWTWKDGLQRLLLGYAMPNPAIQDKQNSDPTLWQGILPFHHIEGSNSRLLGALCQFIDWCEQIRQEIQQPRRLSEWIEQTRQWIDLGFDKDAESQQQLQTLYQVLDNIEQQAESSDVELPVEVFREHLDNQLRDTGSPRGFLSGAITFCEMKPMRAIPSRVVCLLGMNHDAFPRQNSDVQFDLTRFDRQKGDRSTRDDDTYSFLEALLSARESLFISYIGTSIKDGKERPPSTSLQTLLDYEPGLEDCTHEEKLHSFDPHYFSSSPPISHSESLRQASMLLLNQEENEPTSPDKPVYSLTNTPDQDSIHLSQWVDAITRPARYFFKHCLHARTVYKNSPLEADEAISLDPLARYEIRKRILESKHLTPGQIQAFRQEGILPIGELGNKIIDENFTAMIKHLQKIPEVDLMDISVTIDNFTITGSIPIAEIDGKQVVAVSDPSSGKAGTQLKTWIYQLLASAQLNTPVASHLFYMDDGQIKEKKLAAPEDYHDHLSELMEIYHLSHQHPLPHFAQTALAYFSTSANDNESEIEYEQRRRNSALNKWESSSHSTGESEDDAIQYLFPTSELFNSEGFTGEFLSISERIWKPLLSRKA